MYFSDIELCDWPSFEQEFSSPAKLISHFKNAIATADDVLADRFWRDYPVVKLVRQRAWLIENVSQCGFCQPGQIMSAAALLQQHPHPPDAAIWTQMSRHFCSCGTYPRVLRAVRRASRLLERRK